MLIVEILGRPHLMLPHPGRDDSLTACDLVQAFDYVVRLDQLALTIVIQCVPTLEVPNMSVPGREILPEIPAPLDQVLESGPGIPHMRPTRDLDLSDLRGINVDV